MTVPGYVPEPGKAIICPAHGFQLGIACPQRGHSPVVVIYGDRAGLLSAGEPWTDEDDWLYREAAE